MNLNKQKSYLIGLVCGRGHLYRNDKKVIVEFAHKNPTISGIAHCPKCGWLATEKKDNNPNKDLFCKNCGTIVPKAVKKVYEQKYSTIKSIREEIIPFLKSDFTECEFDLVGNDHMTYLIIDFNSDEKQFEMIVELMNGKTGFDSFEIPQKIWKTERENKIEFVNGLLDTAGFFNAGGWLNRPGKNGEGRMRGYFQIVRNWKMPVQLCNFLKIEFKLPIHTIDWGHPNTRDSGMEDYYESNPLSWSREHQLKFFPEYYTGFKIRLKHKQLMFDELRSHNKKVGFDETDDCLPPKKITIGKVNAIHPGETDKRLPSEIRKHHNGYCQICSNLGCVFMDNALKKSNNPKLLYLTGQDGDGDANKIEKEYLRKSEEMAAAIHLKKESQFKIKLKKLEIRIRTNPEQKLYEPLVKYYEIYLAKKYLTEAKVHDTSAFYLDKFIIQNDLLDVFDFCNEYKIKPDIVGFLTKKKKLAFMEVKANELTLQDLGQLLGYCLVAMPEEAVLVAPKEPSLSLVKILKTNPHLLIYGDKKRIEIGTWKKGNLEILNY